MADRIRVTSLIRSRIPPQQEASKNGPRKTALALVGLLDLRAQAGGACVLRSDTPKHLAPPLGPSDDGPEARKHSLANGPLNVRSVPHIETSVTGRPRSCNP